MSRATSRDDVPLDKCRFRDMRAGLALGILAVVATASLRDGWGQSAIDLTSDGYVIVERTTVEGFFQGCDRKLEVHLANGTIFECSERNHHMAYQPKAVLLRNVRMRTYALVIDGRAYSGNLIQLLEQPLQIPLPVAPPQATDPDPPGLTPGVDPPRYAVIPFMAKVPAVPQFPAGQATPIAGQ